MRKQRASQILIILSFLISLEARGQWRDSTRAIGEDYGNRSTLAMAGAEILGGALFFVGGYYGVGGDQPKNSLRMIWVVAAPISASLGIMLPSIIAGERAEPMPILAMGAATLLGCWAGAILEPQLFGARSDRRQALVSGVISVLSGVIIYEAFRK